MNFVLYELYFFHGNLVMKTCLDSQSLPVKENLMFFIVIHVLPLILVFFTHTAKQEV